MAGFPVWFYQAGNPRFFVFPVFHAESSVNVFCGFLYKLPNDYVISKSSRSKGAVRPFTEYRFLLYSIMRKVSEKIQDIGKEKE